MTQEKANKMFSTELGQQLDVLYVTSDDNSFIRYSEALAHSDGKLLDNTEPLTDKTITEWFPED